MPGDQDHPLHGGMMNTVTRRGDRVVRTMVESGDTLFTRDLERFGGWARWDRRHDWLTEQEPLFLRALLDRTPFD